MDLLRWQSHRYNIDTDKRNIDMTAQDIIDLCGGIDFDCILIIVFTFLLLILIVLYSLYQKFQDEKIVAYAEYSYNNKSIQKLFLQFTDRGFARYSVFYPPDLNSYEKYLITFKGWTAQEVYQKIKEHLESILEEYKNTGAFCESDNHALANFLAEIRFAQDELAQFKRQKIDTKLSDFS